MTTLRGVTIRTVNGVHTEPPWPCEAIPTLLRLPARSRARQPRTASDHGHPTSTQLLQTAARSELLLRLVWFD